MPIQRGSSKHGPRADEEQKHEVEGVIRGGGPTRTEEWRQPEPMQDPEEALKPRRYPPGHEPRTPEGISPEDVDRRSTLAAWLSDTRYPAERAALLAHAHARKAPDGLIEMLRDLPSGQRFRNLGEVARALGIGEEHR
ncbi:DUF2795 domain-containing protein [Sphaerisporangium flaviroseum]